MDFDVKKEARRQYFSYFKIWFIVVGVLLLISAIFWVKNSLDSKMGRTNHLAPTQRVYDDADVLTTEQEANLEAYIAEVEENVKCDIVLVTISLPVEGSEIAGLGYRYDNWDLNMRDLADDFYDHNNFGYNKAIEGDGVLLLDNWYEGQAGSWLSTSGSVFKEMGTIEIDELLDDVYYYIEDDPYAAYMAYVDYIAMKMQPSGSATVSVMLPGSLLISLVISIIFILVKLHNKAGKITVNPSTYTEGNMVYNVHNDRFIRKYVSTRRIPRSTGSGGGRSGGGSRSYGGSHRSSSGRSHGGGGRRR